MVQAEGQQQKQQHKAEQTSEKTGVFRILQQGNWGSIKLEQAETAAWRLLKSRCHEALEDEREGRGREMAETNQ